MRIGRISVFLRQNWFIAGILLVILLGLLFSGIGARLNRGSILGTVFIVTLFLIAGLKLPLDSIVSGIRNLRLHLFIQLFVFVITPLLFFAATLPFKSTFDEPILIGIYALACLPTTISSCIIFTQSAEGNVVGAMFNSALANLGGVIVTPLILSLLLQSTRHSLPFEELLRILKNLSLKMLLPILVGMLSRRFISNYIDRHKQPLSTLSNIFILLIVFLSLAQTAEDPTFAGQLSRMTLPFIYLTLLHILSLILIYFGSIWIGLGRENLIAAMYTASQKTLAMGVPLLSTYFSSHPDILGLALLPVLFYHPLQLLLAGFLPKIFTRMKE